MRYLQLIAAILGAIAVSVASAITDGRVDTGEKIQIAIQVTTVVGVWMVANLPGFTYGKTLIAGVLVLLNGLAADILNGITTAEWINLIIAVGTTLGILIVPKPTPEPTPATRPRSVTGA